MSRNAVVSSSLSDKTLEYIGDDLFANIVPTVLDIHCRMRSGTPPNKLSRVSHLEKVVKRRTRASINTSIFWYDIPELVVMACSRITRVASSVSVSGYGEENLTAVSGISHVVSAVTCKVLF